MTSRPIKFRIWDIKLGKYIPWHSLLVHDFESNEYVYEQFTGLEDKDGEEIFEGDIVKYGDLKYKVSWERYKYIMICPYYKTYMVCAYDDLIKTHKSCNIIGNIKETPNLLLK